MKKLLSFLLLSALLSCVGTALAVVPNGSVTVAVYDYNAGQYASAAAAPVVSLLLDGGALQSTDVPAIVWQSRTLVPVRLVSERLGAQVLWVGETEQVILRRGSETIVLTLGSANATVNGKTVTLPDGVPAMLVKSGGAERTMVPLRFVTEQLGGLVNWEQDSYTAELTSPTDSETGQVLDITADANAQTVLITTDYHAPYQVLDFGDRVVVDVQGAVLSGGFPGKIAVDNELISAVRYAEHDSTLYAAYDHTVRVVLDLQDGITYQDNVTVTNTDEGILLTTFLTNREELNFTPAVPIDPQKSTVVLDAGHGGSRDGAKYEGITEKTLDLAVAKKVETILQGYGYNVVMTRNHDTDVGLYERADIANAVDADLFVSIHANAMPDDDQTDGVITFYHPGSGRGERLAQAIQTPLVSITGATDREIRSADFVVLRETDMCAVLVEMGFMTNHIELMKLTTDAYQAQVAKGIAEGIVSYLNSLK
jgi:N-acetylmuramoyl-L-alanine amidase